MKLLAFISFAFLGLFLYLTFWSGSTLNGSFTHLGDNIFPIFFLVIMLGILFVATKKTGSRKERGKRKAIHRKKLLSTSENAESIRKEILEEHQRQKEQSTANPFFFPADLWKVWRSSRENISSDSKKPNQFIETETHEEGFSAHYEAHLQPLAETYEKLRLEAVDTASKNLKKGLPLILSIYSGIVLYWIFSPGYFSHLAQIFGTLIALFFPLSILRSYAYDPLNKLRIDAKKDVFERILSFSEFSYSDKATLEGLMHEYIDFGIAPSYDVENSEDHLVGEYKGVKIELFETLLKRTDSNQKDREIFKGLVCAFKIPKNFEGKTILKNERGSVSALIRNQPDGLKRVKLEDSTFEREFEVYSTDQIQARILLTPSFMERISHLKNLLKGTSIECSFYSDTLLIMIPSKSDLFELSSVFKEIDFVADCKTLLSELSIVFTIVDSLKLDLDVGI